MVNKEIRLITFSAAKDREALFIRKEELPRSAMPNMLLEKSGEITPERMKRWSQSKNNTQL